jgi:hypothetical protein
MPLQLQLQLLLAERLAGAPKAASRSAEPAGGPEAVQFGSIWAAAEIW